MPVYKDNASNRKKGRVGKSYGHAVRPEMVARISALASKRSPAQKAEGRGSAPPPPVAASTGSSFTIIRPTPAPRRKAVAAPRPIPAPRRKAVAGERTTLSTKGGPVARPRPDPTVNTLMTNDEIIAKLESIAKIPFPRAKIGSKNMTNYLNRLGRYVSRGGPRLLKGRNYKSLNWTKVKAIGNMLKGARESVERQTARMKTATGPGSYQHVDVLPVGA